MRPESCEDAWRAWPGLAQQPPGGPGTRPAWWCSRHTLTTRSSGPGDPVRDCPDGAAALQADLELEERQLQRYRDRVSEAGTLGLPDVAEALRPLLEQTQDHVIELRDALGK